MEHPEQSTDHWRATLLRAALAHVPFDGWSRASFDAAVAETGMNAALAAALFPRGGIDLARAYHIAGDTAMAEALAARDLSGLRFRDRIALAIRLRLDSADREAVRHGAALFALPQHAAEGATLIWHTADAIWTALGDRSSDANWYSKRATLSAVHAAVVLFWLSDTSEGASETWGFVDRRIEDVMQLEKAKAALRENPLSRAIVAGAEKLLERVSAPAGRDDLPGQTRS